MLLLAMAGGMLVTSCKRTYVCKDQAGNITSEIKAATQSEANKLCNQNPNSKQTAIRK